MDICLRPLHEQSDLIGKGEISCEELVRSYLHRIDEFDGELNSYVARCDDLALAQAREADARLSKGKRLGPLDGLPIALKDIFITKGVETTCCSNMLSGYLPPYEGTHSRRLKEAGAVLLGKLNMDEFAMGSSNEYTVFGAVKNPWNKECIAGGSSGGSASAVAAGLCSATLGTDTGGSIRQPSAMCGLVGMKPTYGRVSRYGMIAFASSLDQAGPMTRDVTDCAMLLQTIAGHDPMDSTCLDSEVPNYLESLVPDAKGFTIGIPEEYFIEGMDTDVEAAVRNAVKKFGEIGAKVEEISLPHTEYAVPTYYIIAPAEASANLARYDGVRFGFRAKGVHELKEMYEMSRTQGFGSEVVLRIVIGTYVLSTGYYDAYYLKAQKVRTLIRNDFMRAFEKCDAILAPTTPTPAFRLKEKADYPVQMYLSDAFTIPANLAGLPGISVPCGFSRGDLPIGMQLMGKPMDEATLLRLAFAYERATEWHSRRPPL